MLSEFSKNLLKQGAGNFFSGTDGEIALYTFDKEFFSEIIKGYGQRLSCDLSQFGEYNDTKGDGQLRYALTGEFNLHDENCIVTTDGASQGIFLALMATVSRGDKVALPSLFFPAYIRMLLAIGADVIFYDVDLPEQELLASISNLLSDGTSLIVVNDPHNPSGRVLSQIALLEIFELSERFEAYILFDDAYGWMRDGEIIFQNNFNFSKVIRIVSLGKYFCLPGLRLGCVISGDPRLVQVIEEAKRHLSLCTSSFTETLAAKLIDSGKIKQCQSNVKRLVNLRREKFEELIQSISVRGRS